jgi:IS30 family transposase
VARSYRTLTNEDKEKMETLHKEGMAWADIGKQIGRTQATVSSYLTRKGYKPIYALPDHYRRHIKEKEEKEDKKEKGKKEEPKKEVRKKMEPIKPETTLTRMVLSVIEKTNELVQEFEFVASGVEASSAVKNTLMGEIEELLAEIITLKDKVDEIERIQQYQSDYGKAFKQAIFSRPNGTQLTTKELLEIIKDAETIAANVK